MTYARVLAFSRHLVMADAVILTAFWLGVGAPAWPAGLCWALAIGLELLALIKPR